MNSLETKKTIKTFSIAVFLNDLGSDMIYPIWPLFVTTALGANMVVLGLLDGLSDAIVSLSQAFSGYLSDRLRKRKIFIWLGYLFGAFSRLGYALATAWPHLIPLRMLDRAGKIRDAPRDAIVAEVSEKKDRGAHFGWLRAMDNLGAVCGILITFLFFQYLGFKNLFLLAAIPSILAVLLILFFIKEKSNHDTKLYPGIKLKDFDFNFRWFLILSSLFAIASFSYSFLLVYAKAAGFSTATIPLLYLLFTAVASVTSLPFGKLADQIGRKTVLFFAYFFWILVCLTFIFGQDKLAIIMAFFLYGLHRGAFEPTLKTFVAELAPTGFKASALGGFQMVIGLCALPSSLLAGFLWEKVARSAPFYLSLGLAIIAMVLLFFVKETYAKRSQAGTPETINP